MDRETGLTPERLSVLSVLAFAGSCSVSQLAEAEQVSVPAISRILSALEEKKLVRRRRSAADRRVVQVQATANGLRLMDRARRRRLERVVESLRPLNNLELSLLQQACDLLERKEAHS